MKVIYKYVLGPQSGIPYNAKVLHVGIQDGKPCLWAIVDPYGNQMLKSVIAIATGIEMQDDFLNHWEYIGTAVGINGRYVFHFFVAKVPS